MSVGDSTVATLSVGDSAMVPLSVVDSTVTVESYSHRQIHVIRTGISGPSHESRRLVSLKQVVFGGADTLKKKSRDF